LSAKRDFKSLSQQRYSQLAQEYVESASHASGSELQRLADIAKPQPEWLVLDIATGGGHTARTFAALTRQIIASDLTLKMLVAARQHLAKSGVQNVSFTTADAENLPFPEATFDLLTCRIAAHHFPNAQNFVNQSVRVLKTGACLLLQDHVLPDERNAARYVDAFEKLRDPSHNRAFSQAEWIAIFLSAGLQVTHVEQIIKRHELLPWAQRQNCSPQVVRQLRALLINAPPIVSEWMQPQDPEDPRGSFANRHLLICGKKV
jgi:ubiquinone/menaquinone biosynthesis C-methylase UbiE